MFKSESNMSSCLLFTIFLNLFCRKLKLVVSNVRQINESVIVYTLTYKSLFFSCTRFQEKLFFLHNIMQVHLKVQIQIVSSRELALPNFALRLFQEEERFTKKIGIFGCSQSTKPLLANVMFT